MNGRRELALVAAVSAILTIALTYPIAFRIGHVGRVDNADGQLSIWNVAWVARTLAVDPLHVFDANMFYPHRGTLAYSESNLGAGFLAMPVYWSTHNPYAAINFVVLLGFTLSLTGTYYLVRRLTGDRRAAAVSAICFGFCPYALAHTSQLQLMLTAGLPFSMLAFHRLADRPTPGRGAVLGLAMAAQALCCGYYGVFLILLVGFACVVVGVTRRLWPDPRYWTAMATAAAVAILAVLPAYLPYLSLQRATAFRQDIDEARHFAANWSAYLASSSYAHAWLLTFLPQWGEAVFPGVVATIFGIAGVWIAGRRQGGEVALVYAGAAVLAFWTSFGPAAGLYTVWYRVVPGFSWLRAPARFGLLFDFAVSVLAGVGVSAALSRVRRANAIAVVLALAAVGELVVPLNMPEAPPFEPVYRILATLPRGPVIEMPFYYPEVGLYQHGIYLLKSTAHWMPLVNGYSDYIPPDFSETVHTLAPFPSRDAFKVLEPNRVRYVVFHMYGYNGENRSEVVTRLAEFQPYLRPIFVDEATRLYELIGYPP